VHNQIGKAIKNKNKKQQIKMTANENKNTNQNMEMASDSFAKGFFVVQIIGLIIAILTVFVF
jgi:hypothetical protein